METMDVGTPGCGLSAPARPSAGGPRALINTRGKGEERGVPRLHRAIIIVLKKATIPASVEMGSVLTLLLLSEPKPGASPTLSDATLPDRKPDFYS